MQVKRYMHIKIITFLFLMNWPAIYWSVSYAEPASSKTSEDAVLENNLKKDETVLLFPTNAHYDAGKRQWTIPVHGWVFEPEADSAWRSTMIKTLETFLEVEKGTQEAKRFQARTRMFLVDNERSKNIVVSINGLSYAGPATGANGHFEFTANIDRIEACNDWLNINVITRTNDSRIFSGKIQCVRPSGISVISDIDDTIKDSNVLDKKELMKNTFLKEFRPVTGMSQLYQLWQKEGYDFHYVSASPWQLYPSLQQFLQDKQFPAGSMHLKLVRLKDQSLLNLFDSPEEGKIPTITHLLTRYPDRKFILVGDSGEKDPEIYAEIARRYPDRILRIFIRDIRNDRQRLAGIFSGLSKSKWFAFSEGSDILSNQNLLVQKQ